MAGPSPRGGFGDGVRNSRSAPFSLHSRGVQLLDTTRLFDAPHQIKSASRHLRDLLSSLYVFALVQSWLSVYNLLITISATAFYSFYHVNNHTVAYSLDWTLVAFVIILPMLGFTWLVRPSLCASLPALYQQAATPVAILLLAATALAPLYISMHWHAGFQEKRRSSSRPGSRSDTKLWPPIDAAQLDLLYMQPQRTGGLHCILHLP